MNLHKRRFLNYLLFGTISECESTLKVKNSSLERQLQELREYLDKRMAESTQLLEKSVINQKSLSKRISALDGQLATYKAQVDNLNNELQSFRGKQIWE